MFASVGDGAAAVAVKGVGVKSSGSWRMDLEDTAGVNVDSHSFGFKNPLQANNRIDTFCIEQFSDWNAALLFDVESVDLYSLLGSFKVVFLKFLLLNFRMCIVWENLQIEMMTILLFSFQ